MANWEESFRIFIGIAEAMAFEGFSRVSSVISGEGDLRVSLEISGEGDVPRPAGVDIFSEKINSSRFMTSRFSAAVWSELSLSCAMPLGAEAVFAFANLL